MKNRKKIFQYMIPGIVGLLFNSLYIIVDGIFVSQMLGSKALAAVTLVVPIVELIIALSLMISIGTGIYISYYKGKKDLETSNQYFNTGLMFMSIMAIVITVFLLLFQDSLVIMLGASKDILDLTKEYYFWFVIFVPFFMMNFALSTWVRNDDKPQLAMMTQIIGAIVNIVLDYILMGPLGLGLKGAAIATGLGPVVWVLMILPHFIFKKGDLSLNRIKLNVQRIKEIVVGGLPSFTIEFSLGVMTFLCNIFISKIYHETGIAAFGVIGYINLIVLSIFLGMGQGVQPLISELEGKNDQKEIKHMYKFLSYLSISIGLAAYILLRLSKGLILPIFINNDPQVYALSEVAINMFFIALPITGINILTASLFEARQKVKESVLISLSRSVLLLLPILLILSSVKGGTYIWYAVSLAELATLIIMIVALYLLRYKKEIPLIKA